MVLGWIFLRRRFHISGHSHRRAQAKIVGIAARTNIASTCSAAYRRILSTSKYPTRPSHQARYCRECVVDPQLGPLPYLYSQRNFGPRMDTRIHMLFQVS